MEERLSPLVRRIRAPQVELWWYVDDADATHQELVGKGVTIVDPPHDMPFGRVFSIKEPAGGMLYMLQLRQE